MHKPLLAASLLAAASLFGCDDHSKSTSPPPQPRSIAAAPKPASFKPAPVASSEPDSGTPVAPPDMVALAHPPDTANHLERAKALKTGGDFHGALAEARRAVHDSPSDDEALDLAAKMARQVGQTGIAQEALTRVVAIRTEDPTPVIALARVLLSTGQPEKAVKVGQQAIARDPENPEAYHVTGRAMLSADQLQGAMVMFGKAVELKPDHGYALNNLGFAYLRANMNEAAAEVLGKAADLLPNVAYVHNNLGVALERVGRTDEASAEYMLSTTLSPKYVKAVLNHERMKKTAAISPDESGSATDAVVEPGENIGSGVAPDEPGPSDSKEQPEIEIPAE
jgi:Flp pilus assembly protein TadD